VQRASIERHVVKSAPPLADVTFVFTEVNGAKELWADLPERVMVAASASHNDVLRYNLLQLGGYEVKVQRDAFLVAFDNPVDALCWTAAVQLQLLSVKWPEELLAHTLAGKHDDPLTGRTAFQGLRVKMGVHTGTPKIVQRGKVVDANSYQVDAGPVDYVGHTVLRAGRIQAAAHPGQVLLSDTTKLALRQYDAETLNHMHFEDLGEYHLKGLRVPEKLYSALPRELRSRYFAPPICDLPDPHAARDALAELRSAAANHVQAIEKFGWRGVVVWCFFFFFFFFFFFVSFFSFFYIPARTGPRRSLRRARAPPTGSPRGCGWVLQTTRSIRGRSSRLPILSWSRF
jgi:class 3 adenylate cyclase